MKPMPMPEPPPSTHSEAEALDRQIEHAGRHYSSPRGQRENNPAFVAETMRALRRTHQRLVECGQIDPPASDSERDELEQELNAITDQLRLASNSFRWQEKHNPEFKKSWGVQEFHALRQVQYMINQALLAGQDRTSRYAEQRAAATGARP